MIASYLELDLAKFIHPRWLKTQEMVQEAFQKEVVPSVVIAEGENQHLSPSKLSRQDTALINLFGKFKQMQGKVEGSVVKAQWLESKFNEILNSLEGDASVAHGITKGRKKKGEREKDFLESTSSLHLA